MKKQQKVAEDGHHLLWDRSSWGRGYCKALRTHWYCEVKIPKWSLHTQIHHEMIRVTPPDGKAAKMAYEHLLMLERYGALHKDDPIDERLKLLVALFDAEKNPLTVRDLKKQLWITKKFLYKPP